MLEVRYHFSCQMFTVYNRSRSTIERPKTNTVRQRTSTPCPFCIFILFIETRNSEEKAVVKWACQPA